MGAALLLLTLLNGLALIWALAMLWGRRSGPILWVLGIQAALTGAAFLVYLAQSGDAAIEQAFYFGLALALLAFGAALAAIVRLVRGGHVRAGARP